MEYNEVPGKTLRKPQQKLLNYKDYSKEGSQVKTKIHKNTNTKTKTFNYKLSK